MVKFGIAHVGDADLDGHGSFNGFAEGVGEDGILGALAISGGRGFIHLGNFEGSGIDGEFGEDIGGGIAAFKSGLDDVLGIEILEGDGFLEGFSSFEDRDTGMDYGVESVDGLCFCRCFWAHFLALWR